jgi:hypothetical protein
MADAPTFQSNPYGSFDPSQWANPYSNFYGKALPWPSSYAGWPTDAMGNPIQKPPGMTLNSTPQQAAPAAAAPASGQGFSPQQAGAILQATGNWGLSPQGPSGRGPVNNQAALDSMTTLMRGYQPQQQAPQAAAPAAAAGQPSYDQVLSLLANPGKVTTPGATVPQAAASGQPGPGVLQNFLANWQPAASGPGSGFTQNFNTILRGLQAKGK